MERAALNEGSRTALESAYRAFGGDLWRAIYAYAGGRSEIADEAVAEAFVRAGSQLDRIREVKPWLYRVAFRIATDELRHARAATKEGPDEPDPARLGGEAEVLDLLRTLSPNQRAVFVVREVFGYPTADAAALLGLTEVAVRVHLHGARRRLRGRLEEVDEA